jgi:hypothetical protein
MLLLLKLVYIFLEGIVSVKIDIYKASKRQAPAPVLVMRYARNVLVPPFYLCVELERGTE